MLKSSGLPVRLWGEMVGAAAFLINMLLISTNGNLILMQEVF
jgi:hypothetical protein